MSEVRPASQRLIVALDFPEAAQAEQAVRLLAGTGVAFKVGLEMFVAEGPGLLDRLRKAGAERFFLDLKFHDIPNTVASAVRSAASLGVWMMNLHAASGLIAMQKAAEAATEISEKAGVVRPILIAVTVLTSISEDVLRDEIGVDRPIGQQVCALARLAQDAGLEGVVAPGPDVPAIRQECGTDFAIVTPGIRPAGADIQDQARVNTPADAIRAGSSYLVVGRPITQADDPLAACQEIIQQIESE